MEDLNTYNVAIASELLRPQPSLSGNSPLPFWIFPQVCCFPFWMRLPLGPALYPAFDTLTQEKVEGGGRGEEQQQKYTYIFLILNFLFSAVVTIMT